MERQGDKFSNHENLKSKLLNGNGFSNHENLVSRFERNPSRLLEINLFENSFEIRVNK